jgi:hypothetical protein
MSGKKESSTVAWGKRGIIINIICTVVAFFAGSIYSRWITIDNQNEYIKQLLYNAISEVDCNLTNAWYTSDNYVNMPLYFSDLRTQALWNVYYNKHIIFKDDLATADQVLNCLNEIDWINREAMTQYTQSNVAIPINHPGDIPSAEKIAEMIKDPDNSPLVAAHKDMFARFRSKVAPNLTKIKSYFERRLRQL